MNSTICDPDFKVARPSTNCWERFRGTVASWTFTKVHSNEVADGERLGSRHKQSSYHPSNSHRTGTDYRKPSISSSPSSQLPGKTRKLCADSMQLSRRTENERNIIQAFENSSRLLAYVQREEQASRTEKQRQEVWNGWYKTQMFLLVNWSS